MKEYFGNISRYTVAFYVGVVVFEVLINILLLVFTEGSGNVVKGATYIQKIGSMLKILARETVSVVTMGVTDLLAFLTKFIIRFGKACAKGFRGFLKWIEELLTGTKNGAKVDDLIGEVFEIEGVVVKVKKINAYSISELIKILEKSNIHKFYNYSDFRLITGKGQRLDMTLQDLAGFIKTGNIKEIRTGELLNQMDNYIKIVLKRGYPFGFKSLKDFEKFYEEIRKIVISKLEIENFEIIIQGSLVRKINPKDIDVGILVSEDVFNKLIKRAFGNPLEGTAKHRGMLHALEVGKITSSYAKLSKDRRLLEKIFGEIDLSVILEKGIFDIKPNLKK
ncbi:hypothetical protein [Elizabethkingia miricola]|nr:hypothetical protein [Elizabethkingia miricola]